MHGLVALFKTRLFTLGNTKYPLTSCFSLSKAQQDSPQSLTFVSEQQMQKCLCKANKHWGNLARGSEGRQLLRRESTSRTICELSRCGVDIANLTQTRQFGVHGRKFQVTFYSEKVFWTHSDSRTQVCSHSQSTPHTRLDDSNPEAQGSSLTSAPSMLPWQLLKLSFYLDALLLSAFMSWYSLHRGLLVFW